MQSVGLLEALGLWWSGQKIDMLAMWGIPILWWARFGKLLQFIGGSVVIIDLIGPDIFWRTAENIKAESRKITFMSRQIRRSSWFSVWATVTLGTFWIIGFFEGWLIGPTSNPNPSIFAWIAMSATLILGVCTLIFSKADKLLRSFANLVGIGQHDNIAKWIALGLVTVGFLFDLLAS